MRRTIYEIALCPLARECRNNSCLMRMLRVFNYPLTPSTKEEQTKAKDIEKKVGGKGYLPVMETRLRDGKIEVVCTDFRDK